MRKAYIFAPLLGSLLFAACSDDETEPTPTLAITVGEAITIVQGQSASTLITVTRGGGYDDEVDLTVSNLPAGVTASLAPAQIPAGSGSGTSTLTLTADATAAPGTAQFTIQAEATTRAGLVANTTGSVTVNESPGFGLAVDPATLELAAGGTATSNVSITRTGGFADAVNLTVENLPTGVTASFDDAAPTGDAAVLTLTADATATPGGPTTITVSGAGTPGTQTADIALTITAPANGFSLALDPAALTVAAGASGTSTVNVTRTGTFTGPVALTATGAPDGVTVAFDPASADGATSTATVTVASTVAAGDYPIVFHGNADGQTEQTGTLTLTVGAPAGNDFTLALDPAALTVAAGSSGTSTINVTRTGTFTGPVALTATGAPEGVTVAFNPASADAATSTATVSVASTVVAGDYPIVVHGNADGQTEQTGTLTLTVGGTAASEFTMAVDPTTVTVAAGASGTATVNITRTGSFTGPVALTATGAPEGVTVAFDPASADAGTSTVTITVASTVTAGNYPIEIHGTASGQTTQSATLTLTVTAAGASAATLDRMTLAVGGYRLALAGTDSRH